MRVRLKLVPANGQDQAISIPMDFRRHFISLLKTITEGNPIFHRFQMDRPGYSPYVFAVQFQHFISADHRTGHLLVQTPICLTISTGIYDCMTAICNGAIKTRGKETVLGLKVEEVNLMPYKTIDSSNVYFRIVGHAALRSKEDYADGSDLEAVEETINKHMETKLIFFQQAGNMITESSFPEPIRVFPDSNLIKSVCFHYGGYITTLRGQLNLVGKPQALQFLYDFGVGTRNGQGFGLLEMRGES